MKKFNFQTQMAIGEQGESDFKTYYADLLPIKSTEDLKYDFTLKDGKKVELKCDSYPMEKTLNFFFETISDNRSNKPGGPIRAYNDKIDYFVYYFVKNKVFYWFDTNELYDKFIEYLKVNKPPLKSILNRGWVTEGYAVPRSHFDDICLKKDTV